MPRFGGNSNSPGAIGPDHINEGGSGREYGIGNEKTVLDRPVMASRARARASSAVEDDSGYPYGGPSSRQDRK